MLKVFQICFLLILTGAACAALIHSSRQTQCLSSGSTMENSQATVDGLLKRSPMYTEPSKDGLSTDARYEPSSSKLGQSSSSNDLAEWTGEPSYTDELVYSNSAGLQESSQYQIDELDPTLRVALYRQNLRTKLKSRIDEAKKELRVIMPILKSVEDANKTLRHIHLTDAFVFRESQLPGQYKQQESLKVFALRWHIEKAQQFIAYRDKLDPSSPEANETDLDIFNERLKAEEALKNLQGFYDWELSHIKYYTKALRDGGPIYLMTDSWVDERSY